MKYLLLLLLITITYTQVLVSIKDNKTNKPIPEVLIYNGLNKSTYSNKDGIFNLNYFNKKDTLVFLHLSYYTKKITLDEIIATNEIYLELRDIISNEIKIIANKPEDKIQLKETLNLTEGIKENFSNIGDLLKTNTSLQVKNYGGMGASQTVSSRGMSSENTIVLFNNVKVSDLKSGIFDFSKISSFAIDKIELLKNYDSESPHSSSGGILKLFSGNLNNEDKINFNYKYGSYDTHNYLLSIKKVQNKFSFALKGERSYSSNNYDYKFNGLEYSRKNAHYSKSFLSSDIDYKSENFLIKGYLHYSHFKNGIPGFVVTNNHSSSRADNETNSFLSIINLSGIIKNDFGFYSTLSYHNQLSIYLDPENEIFYNTARKDSRMHEFTFNARLFNKINNYDINAGYEISLASISGMDYIKLLDKPIWNFKDSHKFYLSLLGNYKINNSGIKNINLSTHLSYDLISEKLGYDKESANISYSFGFVIEPTFVNELYLRGNYFNNHRNPTLNERYFSSLLFPSDIKSEKYKGFDIGLDYEFNLLGRNKLGVNYFYINGEDKIIWLPSRMGIHRPINYGKVRTQGLEIQYNRNLFLDNVNLAIIYTLNDARNRNYFGEGDKSFNKLLIYTPQHILNINLFVKYKKWSLAIYNHFESERFFTNDNDINNRLKHHFVTDLSLTYQLKLFNTNTTIGLAIYNFFNEDYMIVQSYPMPLRNITLTYKMEI